MKLRLLPLLLSCLCSIVHATEFAPWFDQDLVLNTRATYLYQNFRKVQIPHHDWKYPSNDSFLNLSSNLSFDFLCAELEVLAAATRRRSFGVDCLRLTGRYRLLNDSVGDPFSVTTGVTLTQAFTLSLKDISSFHHGKIEGLAHVAIGKELPCEDRWYKRWWGMAGIGSADVGSPWLQGELHWEQNFCNIQRYDLFVRTLWGLGHRNICRHDFDGYGPIRHQSVDIGFSYSYTFDWNGTATIGYCRRVYARNFPWNANQVFLSYYIPIGTGI